VTAIDKIVEEEEEEEEMDKTFNKSCGTKCEPFIGLLLVFIAR